MVGVDPQLLQAKGMSPKDVADAINAYHLAYPTGVARIDAHEYPVTMNDTPHMADNFNNIPLKFVGGATVYMRDVAQVRDGSTTQTTIVRRNGSRGALITLLKNGDASTLDIVNQVKAIVPQLRVAAPAELGIDLLFDQ